MKINFFKIIIFFLGVFIIGTFYFGLKKTEIYDTKNLIGTNIENFKIRSLKENLEINQELIKENKYTLINFWASWCAPCRAEHKHLMNLNKNAKNLKLLGINFKDEKNNAIEFLSKFGDPYHNLASDLDGKVSINFGVYGIPESILVDKNLKIIKKFIGPLNQDEYKSIINLTN